MYKFWVENISTFSANWNGKCATDWWDRTLPQQVHVSSLTPASCLQACQENGFIFAGVEAGHECFCGNDEPTGDKIAPDGDCSHNCNGDSSLKCGGAWRLSVFKYGDLGRVKEQKENTKNGQFLRMDFQMKNILKRLID